jgi:hypothetical protein
MRWWAKNKFQVLVDGIALGLVEFLGVGARKLVEHGFDGIAHTGAGGLALAPIEDELLFLEGFEEGLGGFLDVDFFLLGEVEIGFGEEVEEDEFLFGEALGDVALVLFVEAAGEGHEFGEEGFDVGGAGVVFVDDLLEFLEEGGCRERAAFYLQRRAFLSA